MKAEEAISVLVKEIAGKELLEQEIRILRSTSVDSNKFYNVMLTTDEAAHLHSCAASTIRKYADLGVLPMSDKSTSGKILFRASDVLLLDLKEAKKQARQ